MIFLANLLFYKPLNLSQKACVTYYESFTQLEALKCLGRFFLLQIFGTDLPPEAVCFSYV